MGRANLKNMIQILALLPNNNDRNYCDNRDVYQCVCITDGGMLLVRHHISRISTGINSIISILLMSCNKIVQILYIGLLLFIYLRQQVKISV